MSRSSSSSSGAVVAEERRRQWSCQRRLRWASVASLSVGVWLAGSRIWVLLAPAAAAAAAPAAIAAVMPLRLPRWRSRAAVLGAPVGRSSIDENGAAGNTGLGSSKGFYSAGAWAVLGIGRLAAKFSGASSKWCRIMLFKRRRVAMAEDEACLGRDASLLDLPDLAVDSILCRLPAPSLLRMGGVCRELRKRCKSDHLWEALVYEKWGNLAGPAAFREWSCNQASKQETGHPSQRNPRLWVWPLTCFWPSSWLNLARECRRIKKSPPVDSLMAWYWELETGSFWFRAQVYNREHAHVGFILSCYDAELSYDRSIDSFRARYPPHGSRAVVVEEGVPWERLRAPPVATAAHSLHPSDCLGELKPGDHIEVQWRRNKDYPYGWWYGVVGHSDLCSSSSRNGRQCACHSDNTVWLVFNQYTQGSRWRRAAIDRRSHCEEGTEAEGFYGGVRKLRTKDEISIWESLWPAEILE